MRKPLIMLLTLTVVLAGCGRIRDSRINPFNWFGPSAPAERVALVETGAATPTDSRALVAQVTALTFDPYPGGIIVRATGVPPTQGWWDAELVARPVDENGVLVYDFRIFPPAGMTDVNTPYSRQIVVATSLSEIKGQGVRRIVVQGEANAMAANR